MPDDALRAFTPFRLFSAYIVQANVGKRPAAYADLHVMPTYDICWLLAGLLNRVYGVKTLFDCWERILACSNITGLIWYQYLVLLFGLSRMRRKHRLILKRLYTQPVSGNIPWSDIEALFRALGADVSERAGSRVAVVLYGEVRVFHRPHPSTDTDKGAVTSIRKWLQENEDSL